LGGIVCTKQRKTIPRDRGRGREKRNLLQVLRFFAVFVRGCGVLRGVLNELIHRNRGSFGQFSLFLSELCEKYGSKIRSQDVFFQTSERERE
jgi:hypothetical protein